MILSWDYKHNDAEEMLMEWFGTKDVAKLVLLDITSLFRPELQALILRGRAQSLADLEEYIFTVTFCIVFF